MGKPACSIRRAVPADVPLLIEFVRGLAEYEHRLDEVQLEPTALASALFGPRHLLEAVIAEVDQLPAGFALYWYTFSTFRGLPNLYIEDLFVTPALRSLGVGRAVLRHLAREAQSRGCSRLEWSVLTWNEPALRFYRRLGATPIDDWAVFELSGAALDRLAQEG